MEASIPTRTPYLKGKALRLFKWIPLECSIDKDP